MKLLSNVFSIEAFHLIHGKLSGSESLSVGFWKNLMKTYPIFLKSFYHDEELLPRKTLCVTLGGMYFFLFHRRLKHFPEALKEFLIKKQVISETELLQFFQKGTLCIIFKDVVALSGTHENFHSTEEFNDVLSYLMESYAIIPRTCENGFIWDVRRPEEDLCSLETLLKKYSNIMG